MLSTTSLPVCPRCSGYIPCNETPGAYRGAHSRRFREVEFDLSLDELTQVCSECGWEEARLQFAGYDLDDEVWPVFSPEPVRRRIDRMRQERRQTA
jgi:hypothetical protein